MCLIFFYLEKHSDVPGHQLVCGMHSDLGSIISPRWERSWVGLDQAGPPLGPSMVSKSTSTDEIMGDWHRLYNVSWL